MNLKENIVKKKLNKIKEYEKKYYENNIRKYKSGSHYSTNILNNNYNIDFSPF